MAALPCLLCMCPGCGSASTHIGWKVLASGARRRLLPRRGLQLLAREQQASRAGLASWLPFFLVKLMFGTFDAFASRDFDAPANYTTQMQSGPKVHFGTGAGCECHRLYMRLTLQGVSGFGEVQG